MRTLKQYKNIDLGIFLVRFGLAVVFIVHGWAKLRDMSGTIAFFDQVGAGAFWAYVVATVEFLGGLAMLTGVWTYWVGVVLAINMLFAIILVKLTAGFVGGYEFDLLLLLASLAIATIGPGAYTVDRIIKKS
jgi:uncharacterized membrane protein YphA (DoxX/SURF4 family)